MIEQELTGQVRSHLVSLSAPEVVLHGDVVVPYRRLRSAALAAGFDLVAVSSFRDFSRQLEIWNGKYNGKKPLYDAQGSPLDASRMSPEERVAAILHWSALPGASRHHWGTDLDLIDAAAIAPGYKVQLSAAEFSAGGPFAAVAHWLETNAPRYGFFRPFRGILSGVSAEPWHFSFAPTAETARRALSLPVLQRALAAAPLEGKRHVMDRLAELHARYVRAIDWP